MNKSPRQVLEDRLRELLKDVEMFGRSGSPALEDAVEPIKRDVSDALLKIMRLGGR